MSALPPIATEKADIRKMVRLPSSLYFSVLFLVPKPLALPALPNAFHYVVDLGVPEPGAV